MKSNAGPVIACYGKEVEDGAIHRLQSILENDNNMELVQGMSSDIAAMADWN